MICNDGGEDNNDIDFLIFLNLQWIDARSGECELRRSVGTRHNLSSGGCGSEVELLVDEVAMVSPELPDCVVTGAGDVTRAGVLMVAHGCRFAVVVCGTFA